MSQIDHSTPHHSLAQQSSKKLASEHNTLLPAFLHQPDIKHVVDFMAYVENIRRDVSEEVWRRSIKNDPYFASWRFFLTSDPYTRWGLIKPKGYAGDASLMDFAYGHKSITYHIENSSALGRKIYEITFQAKQSNSARERVRLITNLIDEMAAERQKLRIGAFACGHAREFDQIKSSSIDKINWLLCHKRRRKVPARDQ